MDDSSPYHRETSPDLATRQLSHIVAYVLCKFVFEAVLMLSNYLGYIICKTCEVMLRSVNLNGQQQQQQ